MAAPLVVCDCEWCAGAYLLPRDTHILWFFFSHVPFVAENTYRYIWIWCDDTSPGIYTSITVLMIQTLTWHLLALMKSRDPRCGTPVPARRTAPEGSLALTEAGRVGAKNRILERRRFQVQRHLRLALHSSRAPGNLVHTFCC